MKRRILRMNKPVVLVVMDGVGETPVELGNMVLRANTPTLDWFKENCPWQCIKAHGGAVGLPSDDDMGNSEVGHNALGCGQQGGYLHMYRGATEEVTLHKKMRLAIGVNDDYVEKTIEAIVEGARTGEIGDGKIFVLPMDECVRIRTGERGPSAIG
jgi:nitrogen regulatory protein P-II 1